MHTSPKGRNVAAAVPPSLADDACAEEVTDPAGPSEEARQLGQMEHVYHNRLRSLLEVSQELSRSDSVDELCHRAIRLGRSRLGFDRLSIWFVREDGQACAGMFGTDESGNIRDERAVHRRFDPAIIGSRPSRPSVREGFRLTDAHGFIVGEGWHAVAEIWGEDRFIGLLNADNLLLREPITDYDAELLMLYATSIGHLCIQQRAAEAKRESEQRVRNIVQSVPIITFSAEGATGKLLLLEGDVEGMLGRKTEEFYVSKDQTTQFIHPEDRDRVIQAYQDGLASERPFELEYRILHGVDQHPVWICLRVGPVIDDEGRLIRHDGVILDITQRKQAEIEGEKARRQLLPSQKLQSLGTLVGGIAHDFNNMLTIVSGNAALLESSGPLTPPQAQAASDIAAAARQATEMTRSLQALSKPAKPRIQRTDVHQLVGTVHRLLRRLIPATIEFRLDSDPDSYVIAADPGQIQQVLVNLCVNARDAMPGGGVLEIQTRTVPQSALPDGIRSSAVEDEYVLLRVTDNGTGMDEATLTQAFDPFFSTKPKDRSTGLGLSVVHRVVEAHNGFVELTSHPNEGTCCDVYLPAIEPCSEDLPSPEPSPTRAGGEVLIVEDEEMVGSLLKTALESRGFHVTLAVTPREGIEIAESSELPFCLAIVDYSMPEMTGDRCIVHIRRTQPDLKAILMTGYSIDEEELCAPGIHVVHKPFSIPTLLETVRVLTEG